MLYDVIWCYMMLYDVIWSCYHHMSSHITTYYRMTSHGINKVACHLSHFLTISEGHYGLMMVCRPYAVICCYMLLYAVIWCYMMLYDVIWWYMMVYDVIWSMVYDGIWCYMMLYDVIWCYMRHIMAYQDNVMGVCHLENHHFFWCLENVRLEMPRTQKWHELWTQTQRILSSHNVL
jgi:hypothetical protein